MAEKGEPSCNDIEQGPHHSPKDVSDGDDALCFSDAEDHSWHSPYDSRNLPSSAHAERRVSAASCLEIDGLQDPCRESCISGSSLEDELESGTLEIKANADKAERDCRICHLSLEKAAPESGVPIVLGCSCKDDLAAAHKQCAETWFKIKGNKICEICGSTAHNVVGSGETEPTEEWNEANSTVAPPAPPSGTRRFWQGHRFLNLLLACLVFAFVISWLFRFNAH